MRRWGAAAVGVAVVIATAGCAERTMVRSTPSRALLTVNGKQIGETPVLLSIPNEGFKPPIHFRLERDGYEPQEGELRVVRAGGRIAGAIFTLGILAYFRPMEAFAEEYRLFMIPEGGEPLREHDVIVPGELEEQVDYLRDAGIISRAEHDTELDRIGGRR